MSDEQLLELSSLVNGCRDDAEGKKAKQNIVNAFLGNNPSANHIDIICFLHGVKSVVMNHTAMILAVSFQKPGASPGNNLEEAGHPGLYLAGTLAPFEAGNMREVAQKYFAANEQNPKVDVVACLRFINKRGYLSLDREKLFSESIVNWAKPPRDGVEIQPWKKIWDPENPNAPQIPEGPPMYVDVRDSRGKVAKVAFLGACNDDNPRLQTPSEILLKMWKLVGPSMCISTDAGSMHPMQCDSTKMMHNLPQFKEWVIEQEADKKRDGGGKMPPPKEKEANIPEETKDDAPAADGGEGATGGAKTAITNWGRIRTQVKQDYEANHPRMRLADVIRKTIDAWQGELAVLDTDALLADGSINNLIFTKLKDVFAATLDAAKLAGAWIVVDRTDGQGSATAEILLELALERGAQRPVIVAIDSLERMGMAKPNTRCHTMIENLAKLYYDPDAASQLPNGTEAIRDFDFMSKTEHYMTAAKLSQYQACPDESLPLPIVEEHKRKEHNGTVDPLRKWRYFYVDGLFASATHYIIKSNDTDEFNMETLGRSAFLYAHGDTRTYTRLRANIQQGKPIVMLHNSGGVVTAFSWLQRVMAHMRPPPDANKMRGPLKFLVANLSKANWVKDFGTPEVIMMRTLAERAPHLFRKNVVSVDILTESEEQTLEVISGCFALAGGVPELGLGNAEVNVVFAAWNMHLILFKNAKRNWRLSIIFQTLSWTLAIVITTIAVTETFIQSYKSEWPNEEGLPLIQDEELMETVLFHLQRVTLILPIIAALLTTIASRMLWRDKWSVCIMAAEQLTAEIYKFRMVTLQYDPPPPGPGPDGEEMPPLTAKEKARLARQIFVERVQAMYGACLIEMSQASYLKRVHPVVKKELRHEKRISVENKPTLSEWFEIKKHVEKHYFKTPYAMPVKGDNFLNWISGLRPYLNQRTVREELRTVIEVLATDKKITLKPPPLSDKDSDKIRVQLALRYGLPGNMFDAAKEEIRAVQREIVTVLHKEMLQDDKEKEKELQKERELAAAPSRNAKGGAVATAKVAPVDEESEDEEETTNDGAESMRMMIMQMQGRKYGKLTYKEKEEEKKKAKRRGMLSKQVDDDYLVGPLSIDTYVTFRVRPLAERLEKQAVKLAVRLTLLDILGFMFSGAGAILAAYTYNSWISLTVALNAVVNSITEFTQLRNQVVSTNLALRELHAILVWWDSLSLVKRRTPAVQAQIVSVTEEAFLSIVDAHTTAASNTQISVAKSLDGKGEEEEEPAE